MFFSSLISPGIRIYSRKKGRKKCLSFVSHENDLCQSFSRHVYSPSPLLPTSFSAALKLKAWKLMNGCENGTKILKWFLQKNERILNFLLKLFKVFCIFSENKWKINTKRCVDYQRDKINCSEEGKTKPKFFVTKRLLFNTSRFILSVEWECRREISIIARLKTRNINPK